MDVGSFVQEFGLAALGACALLVSSWMVIRAGRRDRDQAQHLATKERIDRLAVEIRHIERCAKIEPFYPGAEL